MSAEDMEALVIDAEFWALVDAVDCREKVDAWLKMMQRHYADGFCKTFAYSVDCQPPEHDNFECCYLDADGVHVGTFELDADGTWEARAFGDDENEEPDTDETWVDEDD